MRTGEDFYYNMNDRIYASRTKEITPEGPSKANSPPTISSSSSSSGDHFFEAVSETNSDMISPPLLITMKE